MQLQEPGRLWVVSCKFCRGLDGSEDSGERRRFVPTPSARADQPEAPAGTSGRSDQLGSAGYVDERKLRLPQGSSGHLTEVDCWLVVSPACVRSVGRRSGLAMGGEPVLAGLYR